MMKKLPGTCKAVSAVMVLVVHSRSSIGHSFFRSGARFSVRVSAIEVVGSSENLRDLLADQAAGM